MIYESLTRTFEIGGMKGVLVQGVKKLFSPVVEVGGLIFFKRDLHEPLPAGRTVPNAIAREAFARDLDLFDEMPNAATYKQAAHERFNRGDRCFVGIDSVTGKLANFRWVTTAPEFIPEIARYIRPKSGEAYIYDMFTMPEFRKRGFDHCVRRLTYSALAASGIHRAITYIRAGNFANLRASRHYLTRTGRLWYVQIRGRGLMVIGANRCGIPLLTTTGAGS